MSNSREVLGFSAASPCWVNIKSHINILTAHGCLRPLTDIVNVPLTHVVPAENQVFGFCRWNALRAKCTLTVWPRSSTLTQKTHVGQTTRSETFSVHLLMLRRCSGEPRHRWWILFHLLQMLLVSLTYRREVHSLNCKVISQNLPESSAERKLIRWSKFCGRFLGKTRQCLGNYGETGDGCSFSDTKHWNSQELGTRNKRLSLF